MFGELTKKDSIGRLSGDQFHQDEMKTFDTSKAKPGKVYFLKITSPGPIKVEKRKTKLLNEPLLGTQLQFNPSPF